MSTFIPSGLLADARTLFGDFFGDSLTVSRTNAVVTCVVEADAREIQPIGQPEFMRMRRWAITMPDATDVRKGDVLTVAGKDTYVVLEVTSPTTYSVSTLAYAIRSRLFDGSIDLYTNATVTFESTKGPANVPGAPTLASSGTSGADTGTHVCAVSYVYAGGQIPAGTTATITLPSPKAINWSSIPIGPAGVTARMLWRTKAGQTPLLLVTTLADNTTTSYVDTIPDGSLPSTQPPATMITASTGVAVAPVAMAPHLKGWASEKSWVAYFDPLLTYADGSSVVMGDYVDWPALHSGTARISSVRTLPDIRPVAFALWEEEN